MKLPRYSPAIPATFAALMMAACSPSSETEADAEAQSQGAIERSAMGEITATIGGTAYRGQTLDVPSEGTSTAEFRNFGPATTISLQAHDPDAQSIMSNVLSVDFTLAGNDASAPLSGATVSYFPDGMNEPFYSSENSVPAPEVSLDALSLEDGAASVTGEFTANLCRKAEMFSEVDTSDCVTVEGSFETALRASS